jgi:putative endonuclease
MSYHRHSGACRNSVNKNDMIRQPCVYILTNQRNGTLYTGVTSDLPKRIWEHKIKVVKGFTEKYRLDKLVWYEQHSTMESAINREKIVKKWKRRWKLKFIEDMNPDWRDLYEDII